MLKIGDEVVIRIKQPHLYNKIAVISKILEYNRYFYNYEVLISGSHIWVRDFDIILFRNIKCPKYFAIKSSLATNTGI